ncbi:SLBB domain-containing protein [Vibrio genomosp. F6]|uniref:Sugar transporter n=1 Tax=Vibrio genomosp. F6 str. FF-238 TaxID=1191298 RepID=A0A1E5D2K3_9VIBR|nr:SLBB domain-containing protein [Vibrio genomosp. F6]OEE77723.1 sugar transporter [Vibrio genomosp. F6 str. FF-238]
MFSKKTVFALIASAISSGALAFNPTPAQLQQFQSLPKAQQEQLARQYGVDISVISGKGSSSANEKKAAAPQIERTTAQLKSRPASNVNKSQQLKPFGYDVLLGEPLEFTNVDNLPVPLDYVMAAGDEIKVQVYGKTSQDLSLTIDREGFIHFPDFGPLAVSGQTFEQLRTQVIDVIKQKIMGVDVVVSMGAMRAMQVFIVGETTQPGAYNVNGLTSMTQALLASGGIKETGSLRNIQLKRKGKVVATLDMYDLLLKGDTSSDVRLLAGDTLFVPAKASNVTLDGEVVRPALYELKNNTTIGQLLSIAGGAKPQAYLSQVSVRRFTSNGIQQITLDLAKSADRLFVVKDGDDIHIGQSSNSLKNAVAVRGEVVRQGAFNFTKGMRIRDVIGSIDTDLKQSADLKYALLVREKNDNRDIDVYQFNLLNAITKPHSKDNLLLAERDQLFIFDNGIELGYWFGAYANKKASAKAESVVKEYVDAETGAVILAEDTDKLEVSNDKQILSQGGEIRKTSREELLSPLIERLKAQSTFEHPARLIEISGAVKFPGIYPLPKGESISKVIAAAGGLKEQAYLKSSTLTRRNTQNDKFSVSHINFSLSDELDGNSTVTVQPQDHIVVKTQPNWQRDMMIELQGEVVFPGTYTFQRGETLQDIIQRAGGFTEFAYPQGAIFSRERLKRQEQERLDLLNLQLKQEIGGLALRRQNSSATYTTSPTDALSIADELAKAEAVGRLVINLQEAMAGYRSANVMLEKGDKLYIPALNPTISVMGEVQYASNHTFKPGMTVEDYLATAGGTKKQADTDRIYIVRADGSVDLPNNSFWFSRKEKPLAPGDTIIVPIDTDYLDGLSTLTSATQILYQIGVAWSAVKD